MQQHNNIENKLRQLGEEQQPDLSHMDAHWQQMQAMLQPGLSPAKKGLPKWMLNALSVAAVVILMGGAIMYLQGGKKNGDKAVVHTGAVSSKKESEVVPVVIADSAQGNMQPATNTPTVASINQYNHHSNGDTNDFMEDGISMGDSLKLNFIDCDACPAKKADSTAVEINRQMMLQNLFEQLKKKDQVFVIDNNRDTLLQFEEGTELLVPANSFGGMRGIELTAREFYNTSDMVLNHLNTVSNKKQLETGGMFFLEATYMGGKLPVKTNSPLTLFLPDTSGAMESMQLFYGEAKRDQSNTLINIDWVVKPQYFVRRKVVTMVKALNIIDQPYKVKQSAKGEIGYFFYDADELKIDKEELKKVLREKYGYYKVRLREGIFEVFGVATARIFNRDYATKIGSVVWMEQAVADKYKLAVIEKKQFVQEEISARVSDSVVLPPSKRASNLNDTPFNMPKMETGRLRTSDFNKAATAMYGKYSINLSQLGWINCDRFFADNRKKINYQVDLGDAAANYYTVLVFDKINSIMGGWVDGKKVVFQNVPPGEPVKVISIGINAKGETVFSLTHTTTSTQELTGIRFESTSVPDLKAALSKMDK